MPFPFVWVGALTAAAVLSIAFLAFGILLKVLDRAATEVRQSILSGIVGGLRAWDRHPGRRATDPPDPHDSAGIEDMPAGAGLLVRRVRRSP